MKIELKICCVIFSLFCFFKIQSQYKIEKIDFISANPYTFNDIITNFRLNDKQDFDS